MYNPFRKRASENLSNSDAFLPLVSHAPVEYILQNHSGDDLLEKLAFLLGTPGSGKTTFGRLFEFECLMTLHRMARNPSFKNLAKVLSDFGAISDDGPSILAARIPMDAEYREIWELPYSDTIKRGLFLNLLQSRCVLTWCNALSDQSITNEAIEIITNRSSPGALDKIGGSNYEELRNKAIEIESSVYEVIHALVPRSTGQIAEIITHPYDPLTFVIGFNVRLDQSDVVTFLKPMVIIDDAHELHSNQFANLTDFFIRRDLKIARWILTRYDIAISANDWIQDQSSEGQPGRQLGRDFTVLLTNQGDPAHKRTFRNAAQDIASRYLQEMPIFTRSHQTKLSALLAETCKAISNSNIEKLKVKINSDIQTLRITKDRASKLEALVDNYAGANAEPADVRLAMLRILLHRYAKRTPQQELFSEIIDSEPKRELTADSGILSAAKLHLMHEFDRPYYYGSDMLADSGNGNIEQFLRSADELITTIETKLIRRKQMYVLSAEEQHRLLKEVANKTIDEWDFPMHKQVRLLIDYIGNKAVEASLTPNAYLDHGANAFGVLRSDFQKMKVASPELITVLHFAAAYNALSIIPSYHCKNEIWTLFQLGGYPIIKYGLPFNKGGFVEGGMQSLYAAIDGVKQ